MIDNIKSKILTRVQSGLSKSQSITKLLLKIKNQAELIIKKRYSAESCNPQINGEFLLWEHIYPHCKFFVDVGANIGSTTDLFLKYGLQDIQLILFEPDSSAHEILERKFANRSNLEIRNKALSDTFGKVPFYEQPNAGEMSSLIKNFTETFSHQKSIEKEVTLSTLDWEIEKSNFTKIDFLKIDAEGYDLKVIRGANTLLHYQSIGIIQFEYNDPWKDTGSNLRDAYSYLISFGYHLFQIRSDGLYSYRVDIFGDYYSYSNYIAVSPNCMHTIQDLVKGKY